MDYAIANKFSEALKYSTPPCAPMSASTFIDRLKEATHFQYGQDKKLSLLQNRQMYISCLTAYFDLRATQEVVPDEVFFKRLADDFATAEIPRKECGTVKSYSKEGRRFIPRTIRYLVNAYFFPKKLTTRLLLKLVVGKYQNKKRTQVLCEPFSTEAIVNLLLEANKTVTPHKETRSIRASHIRIFEAYLKRNQIQSLVPNEAFLLKCSNDLLSQPLEAKFKGSKENTYYSSFVKIKTVREVRMLVNRYFLPHKITNRPILLEVVHRRYERFFALTKNTQLAIAWFEENGRAIKAIPVYYGGNGNIATTDTIKYIYKVTDKRLLPNTVYGKVNHLMHFLKVVGKNGIEHVDETDIRKFTDHCERKKLSKKQDYLAHTATFFINAQAEEFIKDHPFKQVSLKMNVNCVRVDFIPQEGINKLLDLQSLNYQDPIEVRNALACLLGYDTGLRVGELYGLNVTDMKTDGEEDLYVSLDEGIQKGRKPKNILYLFFDETKQLLKHYLEKTRPCFKPRDQALFISIHNKERLCKAALAMQMNLFMHRKIITTFYNRKATAHHLRHSLATLNVDPLGLGLSLDLIVERLRHTKHETAKKHYIHSNPYLQKQKFEVLKSRFKKKSCREVLRTMPLSEFEAFLMDDLRLDPEIVSKIRKKHRTLVPENKELSETSKKDRMRLPGFEQGSHPVPAGLSSEETRKMIKPLGLKFKTFSRYCKENGIQQRQGREVVFKESFIDEIVDEWVRKEEVMKAFNMSRTRFYELLEEKKWKSMKIGKYTLVRLKKLVQSARNLSPVAA